MSIPNYFKKQELIKSIKKFLDEVKFSEKHQNYSWRVLGGEYDKLFVDILHYPEIYSLYGLKAGDNIILYNGNYVYIR